VSQPRPVLVLVTTASAEEAETIAKAVVGERLAACANLVPGVRSIFFWEGGVQDEAETLLILKSREERFPELEARIRSLHSYTVPEIIALPLSAGHRPYLDWVMDTVPPKGGDPSDQE